MKTQYGLTLVELMVTLAVAIILIAVGMPLFSGVAANNRATAQANTFLTAFKLARAEAVRRGTEVSVCAIANPSANPLTCGTAANWSNGLLVFTDGGTVGSIDGGDERVRAFPITTAGATAATSGAFVRFQPRGEVQSMTANAACSSSGTCIDLGQSDATGSQARCLYINASGQIRLERAVCS
ncbi:MAG: GspH/FimT family pseudopilin [Gammaproteobacteria bacterium]|nr:GspH/FimT family pseudopilin [Gammaproteobacteria bacterium]